MKRMNAFFTSKLFVAGLLIVVLAIQPELQAAEKEIAKFADEKALDAWTSVNDGVMSSQ